jgi:acetyl-CoA hydrolase
LFLCFWVHILPHSMAASALLKSRVRRPSYLNKLAKAEDLIDLFPHGSYIGWSGFTGVGYPKYVSCNCALHPSWWPSSH